MEWHHTTFGGNRFQALTFLHYKSLV